MQDLEGTLFLKNVIAALATSFPPSFSPPPPVALLDAAVYLSFHVMDTRARERGGHAGASGLALPKNLASPSNGGTYSLSPSLP